MKTTRNILTVVMMMAAIGLAAGAANAALVTQLGILDLTANGGVNPATGNPWQAGDTYRFAFTSSGLTAATSADINYYNTFVQNLANASPLNIGAAQGAIWKAIASTATVDARDNTSTHIAVNGTGESIFLLNGTTIVATDYADLWGNQTHNNAINRTELLTTPPYVAQYGDTWTGTYRFDYPGDPNYGTKDNWSGGGPLGDPDGVAMCGLWPYTSGTHWVWRWSNNTVFEAPMYALSDPLTITDDSVGTGDIPEPTTMALLGLAVAGLGGYVRRRLVA